MVKKVVIVMAMLQATSMNQAMMTGVRRFPVLANPVMRGVGGVAPSMLGGAVGAGQNYNYAGPGSALVQSPQHDASDLFDVDASPIISQKIEQNQAQQAMPVIDVEKIMASDVQPADQNTQPAEDQNGDAVVPDQAPEFDAQEFARNAALQGSAARAIYGAPIGGMQKRRFSTNARSAYVPFKPKSNNAYDVLNVAQGATAEQIAAAYKKLVQQYHPDRNQENKENATQAMQTINNAYDQIKNGKQDNVQSDVDGWDTVRQSPEPGQNKVKYAYNDYRDYGARYRSYGISDNYDYYYDERSRQNEKQWQAFTSDPRSAYNNPKTLADAIAYNDKMRNLKIIQKLLQHATQEEINDVLADNLRSYNINNGYTIKMTDSDFEILKLLIDASLNINYQSLQDGPSLLIMASNLPHLYIDRVMNLIMKKDINPHAIDPKTGCPLLLSLINGRVSLDIIEKIIAKGADVNYVIMPPGNGYFANYSIYSGYFHKKILDVVMEWNKSYQERNDLKNLEYYNSVIALLKKHGAKETSMWEKMKRRF